MGRRHEQTFLQRRHSDSQQTHEKMLNITHHQGNWSIVLLFFYFLFFSTFIYIWDRERQSMNRGGAEREGDTESETGSRLRAISPDPDAGLELTDREMVTWLKSDA